MQPPEELNIVFRFDTLGARSALQGIGEVLAKTGAVSGVFDLDGEPAADICAVLARLQRKKQPHFNVIWEDYEFDFGSVGNRELDTFQIKSLGPPRIGWEDWISPYLEASGFVMAWVANVEYDYWQNAYDLMQYRGSGKSTDHLPKKSNGLPYPLEQTIIDTSNNPGWRRIRTGYYEVVGSVMWLGEHFWRLTGAKREMVESSDWLKVSHPAPSVTKIGAAPVCFTCDSGVEGELQRQLRTLLFPATHGVSPAQA
jgi:hypothetical protein